MKVLFATGSAVEQTSKKIAERYYEKFGEELDYKNVFYFKSLIEEVKKDKTYDRIVVSEDLETFVLKNLESLDRYVFNNIDAITDEIEDSEIIFICSDRRSKNNDKFVQKLFSIGVYNILIGNEERTVDYLCDYIKKPMNKKEAKRHLNITSIVSSGLMSDSDDTVEEVQIMNILKHYEKLKGKPEEYLPSFDQISEQYTRNQLKVIVYYLPTDVKNTILASDKYRYLAENDEYKGPSSVTGHKDSGHLKKAEKKGLFGILKDNRNKEAAQKQAKAAEEARQKELAEKALAEQKAKEAEAQRQAQVAEEARQKELAEKALAEQKAKEAEAQRQVQVAEEARQKELAEKALAEQKAKEAEAQRQAQVAEEARQKELAEKALAEQKAKEAEAQRQAQVAEEARQKELAEKALAEQKAKEAEAQRQAQVAEEAKQKELAEKALAEQKAKEEAQKQAKAIEDARRLLEQEKLALEEEKRRLREQSELLSKESLANAQKEEQMVVTNHKKMVLFVGTNKSGVTFSVNAVAHNLAERKINVGVLDMTRDRSMYYIYNQDDKGLRNIASECMKNLSENVDTFIPVNKHFKVYTSIPNGMGDSRKTYKNRAIIDTVRENNNIVIIDADFTTPLEYYEKADEIYLIQDLDIMKMQEATLFLRELKSRSINMNKIKVVINKYVKTVLTPKRLIQGLSYYSDPQMSFTDELLDGKVSYFVLPFDVLNYAKYIDGLCNNSLNYKRYTPDFLNAINELSESVYKKAEQTQKRRGFFS